MNQPKICQLLGVAVGEVFDFDNSKESYVIDGGGHICLNNDNKSKVDPEVAAMIIAYPQLICIRKPNVTKEQHEICKTAAEECPKINCLKTGATIVTFYQNETPICYIDTAAFAEYPLGTILPIFYFL